MHIVGHRYDCDSGVIIVDFDNVKFLRQINKDRVCVVFKDDYKMMLEKASICLDVKTAYIEYKRLVDVYVER